MVGRYINQESRQFDKPVARFGNLAMLPEFVCQCERSFDQESFLVDMRSHSGFSGAPVFVYYESPGWRDTPRFLPVTGDRVQDAEVDQKALEHRRAGPYTSGTMSRMWLLGIDWGHLPVWGDVVHAGKKFGRMRVNNGMAGVVPAWKLAELLNEEGIKMERDKTESQLTEIDEGASVLDASEPDEFTQFEDLTRQLIRVPKRELDAERDAKRENEL
jgi:hypothetical protein